jgi:trimethylamine corrinoid protein
MDAKEETLKHMQTAVLEGNIDQARKLATQSLEMGLSPLTIINDGMTPAIREVGDQFGRGEIFLPEMVVSADAMQAALEIPDSDVFCGLACWVGEHSHKWRFLRANPAQNAPFLG